MYLRNTRPSTTCLYSLASIEPRSLSAVFHSVSSNPSGWLLVRPVRLGVVALEDPGSEGDGVVLVVFPFGDTRSSVLRW